MNFIDTSMESALGFLNNLEQDTQPLWGTMSATRMVEHLTDTLNLSMGVLGEYELLIPEDKVERAQKFLSSEHPLPKDFQAPFAIAGTPVRSESLEHAIDEFVMKWIEFEDFFETNPEIRTLHPNFGMLNYSQWILLHAKHLTHHFQQFALLEA